MDHDAPCCPDCVGAAGHYLCTGDLLPGASAAMMSTGSCWRPSKRHAPNCCSNCGLEMGVCRTSWKRVSCAQRDARALKALLERMAKDLNARLDLVSAIP
jgi:hypothetical protein